MALKEEYERARREKVDDYAKQFRVTIVDNKIMLYNEKTGELKELDKHVNFTTDENGKVLTMRHLNDGDIIVEDKNGKLRIVTQKQLEIMEQKRYNEKVCTEFELALGGFCWMIYYDNKIFDSKLDIKHISKVMYLATFMEYNTNKLVFQENGKANRPFTEKDLRQLLDLDRRVYSAFKKDVITNEIMTFTDTGIYMSEIFFYKGEIGQYKCDIRKQNGSFSRFYVSTIRTLYEGIIDNRQHKTLGYLFQLLPYCDFNYNVITRSPNTERAYDDVLTKKDIAELLGIEFKAYERIETQLKKLVIKVNDIEYYVIGRETIKIGEREDKFYIINPFIFNSQKRGHFTSLERIWRKLRV